MRSYRPATLLAVLGVFALALSACSGGSSAATRHSTTTKSSSTSATTSTTRPPPTTAVPLPPAKYVTINGKRIRVPTEIKTYPIHKISDTGQNVIIEPTSFRPETLNAKSGVIVFTNLTRRPVSIEFPDYPTPQAPLHSGAIAPGGTFQFKHTGTIALKYTGSNGSFGYLNIDTIGGL